MNEIEFSKSLRERLRQGLVMKNPGKGVSTVVSCDETRVKYRRGVGKKPFYVNIGDLWDAYERFTGKSITTNDLKDFRPAVFDGGAGGHGCHATFFMQVLREMEIVESFTGSGVRGSPFGVAIPPP